MAPQSGPWNARPQRSLTLTAPTEFCYKTGLAPEEFLTHPAEASSVMEEREALIEKLAMLKSEHRDLDEVIARLAGQPVYDQLQLQRLKKRKLLLKDMIARVESRLLPDIIA